MINQNSVEAQSSYEESVESTSTPQKLKRTIEEVTPFWSTKYLKPNQIISDKE